MSKLINPTKRADRKPFSDFLLGMPALDEELADALNDAVHASTETGKPSEVVLKVKLKPVGGTSGQMELDSDVKSKLPKPARGTTLMFAAPSNNLQRQDPRQMTLEGLRTADQEARTKTDTPAESLRAVK